MKLTEEDIDVGMVGEWESSRHYQCTIQFISESEANKIKQQILQNQEIVERTLDLWLSMLDNGIGGMPTKEETKWFNKLTDILPKERRDKFMNEFNKSILGEKKE